MTPLDAPFGALVEGWDPGAALSGTDLLQLQTGLNEHLLLLFRGHRVPNDEELVNFARCFGELAQVAEVFTAVVAPRHPEILPVENEPQENGGQREHQDVGVLPWHADYSYLKRPAVESFLEAVEIPDEGGATSFCNLYRAWDALDPVRRDRFAAMKARHSIDGYKATKRAVETEEGHDVNPQNGSYQVEINPALSGPAVWHPMGYAHPRSGKTALYVDAMVCEFEGMADDAALELRNELIAQATRQDNVYRHEWCRGDFLVFDAFGSLHRREAFDPQQRRAMRQLSTLFPRR